MPFLVNFDGEQQKHPSRNAWIEAELDALSDPAALEQRLDRIEGEAKFSRAYVMGCGRSGTWLITALMSTLEGADVVSKEVPVQYFGLMETESPLLVLKRDWRAYEQVEDIPARINLVYIVRHPFDVLTSHNPNNALRRYHVLPYLYLGNMLALQYLLESGRPRTQIFRYEDLVTDPAAAQARLMVEFQLKASAPADRIDLAFKATPDAERAMHGVRRIDSSSIGKYRNDPVKLEYLRRIRPRLGRVVEWVADSFGYDISLPA